MAEALAIIENTDGSLDLLFTDLGLRDQLEGGLDVGQAAAGAYPGLPVIYTTGREVTDGLVMRFVEPHKLIAKPYIEEHLLTAISDLLNNKKGANGKRV